MNEIENEEKLNTDSIRFKESKITKLFNKESSKSAKKTEFKPLPNSAKHHARVVCESNANSVIEVGSGSGGLLIEMLQKCVNTGIGVDLASESNKLANRRLKEANISDDRFQLIEGSFLELGKDLHPNIADQYDAVSMHLVLCCHPDREGLLNKSTEFKPKVIVLTVPREWFFLKFVVGVWGLFTKITKGYRPYIHSQKLIDNQLQEFGYEVSEREKTIITLTSSYKLKE